jgi:serine/threonine protein kinase
MPPEALFNYPTQTSAIDIWACGVIFLSFLAKRHPIFSLNNSSKVKNFTIANLIPLACIYGAKNIKDIAYKLGYGCVIPEEIEQN